MKKDDKTSLLKPKHQWGHKHCYQLSNKNGRLIIVKVETKSLLRKAWDARIAWISALAIIAMILAIFFNVLSHERSH